MPAQAHSDTVRGAISLLSTGATFFKYDDRDGSTAITEILLFYRDDSEGLGQLCWCDPSKGRAEVPGNVLNLSDIREMTAGKQTPVFESRIGRKADDTRCFSLRTAGQHTRMH